MTRSATREKGTPPRAGGHRKSISGKLQDSDRVEIITRLAMFDTVKAVTRDLNERGIDISHQAVSKYDPSKKSCSVAQKWRDLFNTTREEWLKEIAAEPIAHRAYRLRRLGQLHEKAFTAGALTIAAQMLEQAAKEIGNVYTNVSKVQGAVLHGQVDLAERTPEERRNMLADRIAEAIERMPKAELTKH